MGLHADRRATSGYKANMANFGKPPAKYETMTTFDWAKHTPTCVSCHQKSGTVDTRTGICAACANPAPVVVVKPKRVTKRPANRAPSQPRGPMYSDDQIATWAADYTSGMTLREVAAKHGVAHPTVRRHIARLGVEFRPQNHAFKVLNSARVYPPELVAQIAAEYTAGDGIQTISLRHHIGRKNVRRLIVEGGAMVRRAGKVPQPKAPKTDRRARQLSDDDIAAIAADYAAGMGMRGIASKYRIGDNRTRAILAAAGVTIRPIGQNPSAPKDGLSRSNHPLAKVTPAQHDEILARLAAGERACHLAPEYGITQSAISNIKARAKRAAA